MTSVVDASTVVEGLLGGGSNGDWAEEMLAGPGQLVAPHLLPAEATNVLRRLTLTGRISADGAALAHADLLDLRVELFPYGPFAARVWELRNNVSAYDAWYVALAEHLRCPLATLDGRLRRADGPRCDFLTPPG